MPVVLKCTKEVWVWNVVSANPALQCSGATVVGFRKFVTVLLDGSASSALCLKCNLQPTMHHVLACPFGDQLKPWSTRQVMGTMDLQSSIYCNCLQSISFSLSHEEICCEIKVTPRSLNHWTGWLDCDASFCLQKWFFLHSYHSVSSHCKPQAPQKQLYTQLRIRCVHKALISSTHNYCWSDQHEHIRHWAGGVSRGAALTILWD